jgi:pimeloyl-ACP methyl ester carboxylesterase
MISNGRFISLMKHIISRSTNRHLILRIAFLTAAVLLSPAGMRQAMAQTTATWATMSCSAVMKLPLPHTQILNATQVATPVPHCHVVGVIDKYVSRQDPEHFTYGVGFELNMPNKWNGRFEMMGGGGTDGSLKNPLGSAGTELAQGWAVAIDDGGHEDRPGNPLGYSDDDMHSGGAAHFAIDARARSNYGYAGIGKTTRISKALIKAYYGIGPRYSYLWGCSNGGRDGLVASQRYPDAFNGIVVGNPGVDLPRAAIAEAWNEQQLAPLARRKDIYGQPYLADTFPPQDLKVVSAAILDACDKLDGLVDGIVNNYAACTDRRVYKALAAYTCRAGGPHGNTPHGGQCLTAAQVTALKRIYAGPANSRGKPLYSNWFWDAGIWDPSPMVLGWHAWNVASALSTRIFGVPKGANTALNLTLGAGAIPMIFTTPPVVTPVAGPNGQEAQVFKYDFDKQAPLIYATAPGYPQSAMDFMTGGHVTGGTYADMTPFARHGGKMLIYSSINDGIFSAAYLVRWYESLDHGHSKAQRDFMRLFLIPNMAHCGGGPATDSFNTGMLSAITGWVEHGKVPRRIIAANTATRSPFPAGAPFNPLVAKNFPTGGTRPLCEYPRYARYRGKGPTGEASSFVCVLPNRH